MSIRKRKQGPHHIEPTDLRTHCVSVRLNDAELNLIDRKRDNLARGEWFRVALLDKLPQSKTPEELAHIERTNELYVSLNKTLGLIGAIAKVDRTLTPTQLANLTNLKQSIHDLKAEMIRRRP